MVKIADMRPWDRRRLLRGLGSPRDSRESYFARSGFQLQGSNLLKHLSDWKTQIWSEPVSCLTPLLFFSLLWPQFVTQ